MAEDVERTPTSIVMEAMEEFGKSEPVGALIVWRDEGNDFHLIHSVSSSEAIAMLEMAKHMTLNKAFRKIDG